ncbi:hypothetical protein [Diaphorobacter aerolatus]|uniref:Uncharacterized protein n=1 Tax=Diaphorobacter aerolatus TaxID=1288495 RepID=A0A7H0GLU3_9BURK|nr:hypothetical protein [Diaphorobacter aerolatus]QNP49259.1 hypothetical protein H9K75_03975 [Diaphorobacter aerolatus]
MKDVAAVLAHEVAQVGVVDLFTDTSTNFVTHGAAYNTSDECAQQSTQCTAYRACDHAHGGTGGCALHRTGHTGRRACCASYALNDLFGYALAAHIDGLAAGTLD